MDTEPKLSPVTGKYIHITGVFEIIGFLRFNCVYFMTLENSVNKVLALRDGCGIHGWMTQKREIFSKIKEKGLGVFVKSISSPYIVQKDVKEFEFKQKVTVLLVINNEGEAIFLKEILEKEGICYTMYADYPWY